jgi:hypothetical protein
MRHIFSFGLLVATMAVGSAHAAVQAKFHLPCDARWGTMTLAAGDYQMSLPEGSLGVRQFTVKGNDKTGYVQPNITDDNDGLVNDLNRSYLELVKVNGTFYIAKYRSAATGKLFSFTVPKHKRTADDEVVRLGFSGN